MLDATPSSGGTPPVATIEERIAERVGAFDMPALVELLAKEGYGPDDLELRSHRGTVHAPRLIHSIDFVRHPRRAIITVNLGLLSVQSPLPSFFLKAMERLEHDALESFLGYFDHLLLRARFAGLFPERDESLLPGWEQSAGHRLRLLRPGCPSTLHWLVSQAFPEAEVRVRRSTRRQRIDTRGIRLGGAALGDGTAMGGYATVPTGGLEAWLYVDEAFSGTGAPWAVEARRRLRARVLPHLTDTPVFLTVMLVLRDQHGHARIEDTSHLGYEPIIGGPEEPRQVVLFSGDTAPRRATASQ
ncbi:type VI secretion system baseplate subunit TssG [Myxococcus stipitatus]|uniref:type VI secretion system baseplate subunit TssG n=1 Tax=Myxococcus stipitatus TaxID=83455 RepID=UPI001F3BAB28|nr:type VI secretion system baseplate subunit TssG [Myxococcus stipitatus]MCE9666984.1 type VI secretion system baseplate subunit TssG [Myxococcus stipitatus]